MSSGTATTFYGETIDGKACAIWRDVYRACEQFHRFKIEISDADAVNISERQRGWLHCEEGAIRKVMKSEKMTFLDAKVFLKVKFGRAWFVKFITPENYQTVGGSIYWECQEPFCREIIHVAKIDFEGGKRQCPKCGSGNIRLISVKSSENQSVKIINMWFKEMLDKIKGLEEPKEDWFKIEKDSAK